MALTTTGTLSQVLANYYDKRFLMMAEANYVFKQLGRPGVIKKGEGKTVYWTRYTMPAAVAALTEGTDPTPAGLSAVSVTATVAQYGNYEQITDLLSLTSIDNSIASAIDVLAKEAALSIDSAIATTVAASGTAQYASGVANRTSIAASNVVTVADLRKAKRELDSMNAKPHTGVYYVAVAHPDVIYDLEGDTNWTYAHQYVDKGVDNLYTGEAGSLYGIKFIQTTQAKMLTNSGSASTEVYLTNIFGAEWFGVSDLQDLKTYVKSPSPASALELYSTVGWKASFACKELNASFCRRLESAATQ